MGGKRRKIGLTDRQKRLLATVRSWQEKEKMRGAKSVKGRHSAPRYKGSSELVIDAGVDEKLKPLRKARKKEAETMRDR